MDYTKIRPLIYRERQDISEFGIYEDNDSKVNPFLYERLKRVSFLHPSYAYADNEMLRMFNDVYFILTAFFMDERPLANYANYRKIARSNNERDMLSNNRSLVEVCMLYVILNRFNGANWFREKKTHSEFFNAISEEVYRLMNPQDMETMLAQLRGAENIAYTITGECESMRFVMSVKEDFPPRDIKEVINSKESLKDCLSTGKDISVAVNLLCEDNEQKLKLIERLLEPENEHYGVMDSTICAAYRSLYELKSKLTGEPLPEQLPFEKASICTPPMMATPPSFLDYQKEYKADDRDARIAELEKEVGVLKEELSKIQYATDDDVAQMFNDDEQGEPQGSKQPQAEKLNTENDSQPQELTDALKKIEEQEETIKDLRETIIRYQKRGWPPAKRKGIALGLTPLQADIFGDYLAEKLGIVFDNKKKELSLILNCLFGQGLSSLANKMHLTTGAVDDRLYVASIFGPSAPKIAKEICSDWDEDTLAPWEEEVEYNDEDEDESD